MLENWRQRWAAKRIKPGDGHALRRFRWWQMFSRALFHLRLTNDDGRQEVYSVEVSHWENQGSWSNEVKGHLYVNGRHHFQAALPAAFAVHGGTIEVAMSGFGVKRCHYVSSKGDERQLIPDPASAEGRRAQFDRAHPALSRAVGVLSILLLVIGVALLIPQLIEALHLLPPIDENFGAFTSPIRLPVWLNIALAVGAAAASTERAMRMRYHWLLDGAGN